MDIDRILMLQEEFHRPGGVIPDTKDHRDYKAEELMGADVAIPSFKEGYNALKDAWLDMPNQDQEHQFSCVGRGWSHYKQVLQAYDTGEKTLLSSKSIYNMIAIPGKGSVIRDGGLRTVKYGVNKESSMPSNGTESDVTKYTDFTPFADEAAFYKNRVVASVDTQNFDTLAKMIFLNKGFVSGWRTHCQYFKEYGIINGRRYLKTHNSYGPTSDMYFFENCGEELFSAWTAVDVKNMNQLHKIRLVRGEGEKNVFFLLNDKRYLVFNPDMMGDGLAEGIWDGFAGVEVIPLLDLYQYPLVKVPLADFLKLQFTK